MFWSQSALTSLRSIYNNRVLPFSLQLTVSPHHRFIFNRQFSGVMRKITLIAQFIGQEQRSKSKLLNYYCFNFILNYLISDSKWFWSSISYVLSNISDTLKWRLITLINTHKQSLSSHQPDLVLILIVSFLIQLNQTVETKHQSHVFVSTHSQFSVLQSSSRPFLSCDPVGAQCHMMFFWFEIFVIYFAYLSVLVHTCFLQPEEEQSAHIITS